MAEIKIFCIYHKQAPIFKSAIFEPIQTGCANSELDLGFIKDNTGDNISNKNAYYGELSAWYWVWKNYLPSQPTLDYIGFCHYRRFLNFNEKPVKKNFCKIELKKFSSLFEDWRHKKLDFSGYDLIMPRKTPHKGSLEEEYLKAHPKEDLEFLKKIVSQKYPSYVPSMEKALSNQEGYYCLNFVMKKDLFKDFMTWAFDILFELEKQRDWKKYTSYFEIRTPAYLIERFLNVWIEYQESEKGIKILNRKGYFIRNNLTFSQRLTKKILFLVPKKLRKKIKHAFEL